MAPVPYGSYFADLPLESISPNPRQPRTAFDEEAMNELVESIPYDQTRGYTKRVAESYGRYLALYADEMPLLPLQLTAGGS